MYINLNEFDFYDDPFKPKKDKKFGWNPDSFEFEKEWDKKKKEVWNNFLNKHFPSDIDLKKKIIQMSIEEMAEYFVTRQDEFHRLKSFLIEYFIAKQDFTESYQKLCDLIRGKL